MGKIRPFFKGKRKRRTIVFGVLPLFLLVYMAVLYILFYLCGLDPESNYLEMLLLLPALVPGYLIYAVVYIPLAIIEPFVNIIGDTFREKVMMISPILFYIILFLLFLLWCHYYRTKRIKAYKKVKKALTVIWVILSCALIIAAFSFIRIL